MVGMLRRKWLFLVALQGVASGCFYAQGIRGGLEILTLRRPVAEVLADPGTSAELAGQLRVVEEARDFAVRELGLPDNGSYRQYTELGRPYAVWNVVGAPELSVEPVHWCFPFAGCVSYRGYFSQARAGRYAARLAERGFDVQVAGATTYSTLGWFKDPVLSTFVDLPAPHLAGVLFHELAHQRLYLPGDTVFNESFATVVQDEGVRRWLSTRNEPQALKAYETAEDRQREVTDLLLKARSELALVYGGSDSRQIKLARKRQVFQRLRFEYRDLRRKWNGYDGYDAFFDGELNNAHLAAIGAYNELVPELRELLVECSGDLSTFYQRARSFGEARSAEPTRLRSGPSGETGPRSADGPG
ncbi:MAG: aminopeptidase [Acidobacteria bacterium]|nr:aminopeptidase [Acidobacteriota bacterium]